jgi:hypothetical protein
MQVQPNKGRTQGPLVVAGFSLTGRGPTRQALLDVLGSYERGAPSRAGVRNLDIRQLIERWMRWSWDRN